MNKPTPIELAEIMYRDGIRFISGKWFDFDHNEIDNPRRHILNTGLAVSSNQAQAVVDAFVDLYNDPMGKWYDMRILTDAGVWAAELMDNGYDLPPLTYPLTEKQLLIINRLLTHEDELMFILTGVGGSGKSTFANIVCQIFDGDVGYANLDELSNDFKLGQVINHRLIFSDELNKEELKDSTIKRLISNQSITVNPKFGKPYQMRCQSVFMFNCNIAPRVNILDTGILRRIIYYSMDTKIENPDPTLGHKTFDKWEIYNIICHATLIDTTGWQEKFKEDTIKYLFSRSSIYKIPCKNYAIYKANCELEGLKPYSKENWESARDIMISYGVKLEE